MSTGTPSSALTPASAGTPNTAGERAALSAGAAAWWGDDQAEDRWGYADHANAEANDEAEAEAEAEADAEANDAVDAEANYG